ncbi:class I adenylate-forming enzyme family protein [Psychrobacillus soli]|uniref:Long-chain fatty acid--CoA ligase n=1 Tax=Psychrobacillus soli TaxID=1543965 RepID=A0A544TLC0_9BACI|nr:AMP-binding protein [Psychrobacillus soli]TQR18242.1 long-chain fatty acid--CoA ligase [Psychrobacillus soli]
MNLDTVLQKHARTTPNKLALGWESGEYTYQELNEKIQNLATHFLLNGSKAGDRIALIVDNCPEFVISYYACMRVGAISVPINPNFTSREFSVIINDSTPKIIVTNEIVKEILLNINLECDPKYFIVGSQNFNNPIPNDSMQTSMNLIEIEEGTILYTSGTTGTPKGAILTHQNLYHNAKTFAEAFNMKEDEKTLIVAPLFHTAAQSNCLNSIMYSGGYSYLLPRWKSSAKTLSAMQEQKTTFFFGPPTMYTYMLSDPNIKEYNLKLRFAYTGGAPLSSSLFNKWRETMGFEIVEGYGLTECSPVVSINPPNGRKKLGSVGIPINDVSVKIVNELFEEVGIDEPGELLVKGPNVMQGYYKRLEDTQIAFIDGWFKTGDIAKRDTDGYLYIVDRKKDMIIRSGFNVYPKEVEDVLCQHPAVLEAAVIGFSDNEKGELVKAVVLLKDDCIENITSELEEFCKKRLATYKVPQKFEIVKELPKTNLGKIIKAKLRELYV